MSVAELKETKSNLKAWIDQLSDAGMIQILEGLRLASTDKSSWDDLSEFQKQQINAGLEDIEQGRVMSSEEFWSRLKNG
jgi:predicted transcriptional regulator